MPGPDRRFARINHGLGVQRQVVRELGDEHMGQQARAGDAALDRAARRWRLHDGIAAATGQFWAHMANHAEAGRHELELLGYIFTQLLQISATGRAICRRRQIHFFIARQMFGQRFARRTLTWRAIGGRHFPFSLGVVRLQIFQLQFKLFDLMVELLGLAAELHAPQFCDPQFQMLDLGIARVQARLQSQDLFIARQQQCLQGFDIVWEFGGGQHGLFTRGRRRLQA